MTLRKRTALIVIVAMAAVVTTLFAVGWRVVGSGFGELEETYAARDSQRVLRAIEREVEQIDVTSNDWATWDDTYDFVLNQDVEYRESNLGPDTLASLRLDTMAILSSTGQPVYREAIERKTAETRAFPRDLLALLSAARPAESAGIVIIGQKPMLLAIRPVLRSDGSGPPVGTLAMGRWLDSALLASLSEQTVASASLVSLDDAPDLAVALGASEEPVTESLDGDWSATYALLPTLDGGRRFAIQTVAERAITGKGESVLTNLAILLAIAGGAFGIVTFGLLELGVIRRLRALGDAVHRIGARADIRQRVNLAGGDEVGRLSGDIDSMLDSLDQAEQRYRRLVQDAVEGIVLLADGRVSFANPTARAMFEADDETPLHDLGEFLEGDDRGAFETAVVAAVPGETTRLQVKASTATGGERVLDMSIAALAPGEVQVLIRDNTDIAVAAREKQVIERRMQEAQRLESIGLLAGGVAHDFNNLLMVVLGNASLIEQHLGDPGAVQSLKELESAGHRATELTQQLLAYAGKGTSRRESLDLSAVAGDTTAMVGRMAGKFATVETQFAQAVPPVEADPTQVRQVILNLLTNAADALPGGNGTIRIATGNRELSVAELDSLQVPPPEPASRWVYIEVSDTGRGMSDDVRTRMFEPFYSTKGEGRGLGLAATLGIIRASGGALDVRSAEGRGTTITVFFPASGAVSDAASPPAALRARLPAPGASVLVVDDDPAVRKVTARFLRDAGYSVTACDGGREALDALQGEHHFDVVVLDVAMPGVDGLQVLRQMRAAGISTPAVMMSGFSHEAVPAGERVCFLQKPFLPDDLLGTIDDALERKAA